MITQNKENAKVTIVIPIYKVAAYIADCLRSVYAQTYPQLEVILVNDATPDDSMEQAASWIDKLRERFEVKVVTHEHNRGLSAARNTGIKEATGGWIYFLDSDDEITPDCIELMVKEVEKHPDVDFVIGGIKVMGNDMTYPLLCKSYVSNNKEILSDYTTSKWYVMAWNHLYNKFYLVKNNLYFKEGFFHEDQHYSFQVAITAQAMATVYDAVYIYKVRTSGSITSQRRLKNFEDILLINEEKYKWILNAYQSDNYTVPFSYCLDMLYEFECCVVANKFLSLKVKYDLITRAKALYLPLEIFNSKMVQTRKYKILFALQKMPIWLIYSVVRLRLAMRL